MPITLWIISFFISFVIMHFSGDDSSIFLSFAYSFLVFSMVGVIIFVPLIFLYFSHSKKNKNSMLEIEWTHFGNNFKYQDKDSAIEFSYKDISEVNTYLPYNLYTNNYSIGIIDSYFYYKIKFKDNREIFLSCIIINNLENYLPEHLFKKNEVFLAFM